VRALDDVTVEVPGGRFTAVMGPSGSGKSMLMHCVAGLDELTSGRAFIGDLELGSLSDRELTLLRREQVGFVFQSYNLVPTLSALENITLPMDLSGVRAEREWLDAVITMVRLGDRLAHRPSELSGGQQQRVAVARALASRPRIVFADEPTGNLDSRASEEMLTFMRRAVHELGQTIVMVTHDPVAAADADGVLFLADGRIVARMDEPSAQRCWTASRRSGADRHVQGDRQGPRGAQAPARRHVSRDPARRGVPVGNACALGHPAGQPRGSLRERDGRHRPGRAQHR
jgi:putative ABC transport system ATP-binding protein